MPTEPHHHQFHFRPLEKSCQILESHFELSVCQCIILRALFSFQVRKSIVRLETSALSLEFREEKAEGRFPQSVQQQRCVERCKKKCLASSFQLSPRIEMDII